MSTRTSKRKKKLKLESYFWNKDNFYSKKVDDNIGQGVFTKTNFNKGSFLMPYEGHLLDKEPVSSIHADETYLFEFSLGTKKHWIDATIQDGSFGRLINDCHKFPNCIPKPLVIGGSPAIGIFALRDINAEEELRYCYGGRNQDYPWRQKKSCLKSSNKPTELQLDDLTFCGLLKRPARKDQKPLNRNPNVTSQKLKPPFITKDCGAVSKDIVPKTGIAHTSAVHLHSAISSDDTNTSGAASKDIVPETGIAHTSAVHLHSAISSDDPNTSGAASQDIVPKIGIAHTSAVHLHSAISSDDPNTSSAASKDIVPKTGIAHTSAVHLHSAISSDDPNTSGAASKDIVPKTGIAHTSAVHLHSAISSDYPNTSGAASKDIVPKTGIAHTSAVHLHSAISSDDPNTSGAASKDIVPKTGIAHTSAVHLHSAISSDDPNTSGAASKDIVPKTGIAHTSAVHLHSAISSDDTNTSGAASKDIVPKTGIAHTSAVHLHSAISSDDTNTSGAASKDIVPKTGIAHTPAVHLHSAISSDDTNTSGAASKDIVPETGIAHTSAVHLHSAISSDDPNTSGAVSKDIVPKTGIAHTSAVHLHSAISSDDPNTSGAASKDIVPKTGIAHTSAVHLHSAISSDDPNTSGAASKDIVPKTGIAHTSAVHLHSAISSDDTNTSGAASKDIVPKTGIAHTSAVHLHTAISSDDPNTSGAASKDIVPETGIAHTSAVHLHSAISSDDPYTSLQTSSKCLLQDDPVMCFVESDNDTISDMQDTGSEYVPSDNDEIISDSENSVTSEIFPHLGRKELGSINSIQDSKVSSSNGNNVTERKSKTGDIRVLSTNKDNKYDKRYYCPYCSKPQAKLPRHLLSVHKEEDDIRNYSLLSDKAEKEKVMTKIRNLGNHRHNSEVLRKQEGDLVVVYRTNGNVTPESFLPCQYCLGYYVSWELWKHTRRCCCAPKDRKKHQRVVDGSKMLLPSTKQSSEGLSSLLATMKTDRIGLVVKNDPLILQLGEKLFLKNGHDREQFNSIRNTLRESGRLLINLRENVGPIDARLENFIDPVVYKQVVNAARAVAGFSEDTHLFTTPSLALKLGHTIKKCARIIESNALQSGDEKKGSKAASFFKLCEMSWTEEVSTHALRTLVEFQRNKVKLVPLVKDVTALTMYLRKTGEESYIKLNQKSHEASAWITLNEMALAQLIQFNRRRQGEVSKAKIEDYYKQHTTVQEDINLALSPLEQKLCQTFKRIEIIGKRGRTVPMIVTPELNKWIDLLLKTRENIGVHKENNFLFPRCHYGSLGHIRGCDVLRDASEVCGAKYPELLRSTKLRKQIATLSQVLNLKDNELDILANFLGHDIRVHREFYRLPEETIQVAKISKLLLAMDNGQFPQQQGKSLDEITVDMDEDLDLHMDSGLEASEEEDNEQDDNFSTTRKKRKTKKKVSAPGEGNGSSEEAQPVKTLPGKRIWSEEEKAAVRRHFDRHIILSKVPKKSEVDSCLSKEKCLRKRTWRNIKDHVRNQFNKKVPRFN